MLVCCIPRVSLFTMWLGLERRNSLYSIFDLLNILTWRMKIIQRSLNLICNCKITDKVFESFVQISLEKNRSDQVEGEILSHVPECLNF